MVVSVKTNQDIYILGINPNHNCSAALIKNGVLVSCVSEERFSRKKNQLGLPKQSIDFILKNQKILRESINHIVFGFNDPYELKKLIVKGLDTQSDSKKFNSYKNYENFFTLSPAKYLRKELFEALYYKYPKLINKFIKFRNKKKSVKIEEVKSIISKELDFPEKEIMFLEHHKAHAYSALGFIDDGKDWLVITVDGEGDGLSASVNKYIKGKMIRVSSTLNKNSLGLLYGYTTHYLGMKRNEHEYKVMGLAPYAKNFYKNLLPIFEKYLQFNEKKLIFESNLDMQNILPFLRRDLCSKRFDDIAAALQEFTENSILNLVRNAVLKTGIKNVALSGGVIMNVKANSKILNLNIIKEAVFVPTASDESVSWGAAFWVYNKFYKSKILKVESLYFGPSYTENEIINEFRKFSSKLKLNKSKNIFIDVAKLLKDGYIVAWFQDKAEWGARALGNRSILANPQNPETVKIINQKIKNRDFWMPFAPSILESDVEKYVEINKKNLSSYYMMLTFNTTDLGKKYFNAALHPADQTARVQIVKKEHNLKYYKLLCEFKKMTGIGGVLNTSFNLHGEPIVCSPSDAFKTLLDSGLEYLAIGNFIVTKK